jgi:hypothetical protein
MGIYLNDFSVLENVLRGDEANSYARMEIFRPSVQGLAPKVSRQFQVRLLKAVTLHGNKSLLNIKKREHLFVLCIRNLPCMELDLDTDHSD